MIEQLGERLLEKNKVKLQSPLDLVEVRRQLIATRSLYSHDTRVTTLINDLLVKVAHLRAPEDREHEKHLRESIAETIQAVKTIAPANAKPKS